MRPNGLILAAVMAAAVGPGGFAAHAECRWVAPPDGSGLADILSGRRTATCTSYAPYEATTFGAANRSFQVVEKPAGQEPLVVVLRIGFDFDSSELKPPALRQLKGVAAELARAQMPPLRIEGHTDATGTDDYNLSLSDRRAQAVLAQLVADGVPQERAAATGFGETRLLAGLPADHADHRRVEIHFAQAAPPP